MGSPSDSRKIAGVNEPASSPMKALRDSFSVLQNICFTMFYPSVNKTFRIPINIVEELERIPGEHNTSVNKVVAIPVSSNVTIILSQPLLYLGAFQISSVALCTKIKHQLIKLYKKI